MRSLLIGHHRTGLISPHLDLASQPANYYRSPVSETRVEFLWWICTHKMPAILLFHVHLFQTLMGTVLPESIKSRSTPSSSECPETLEGMKVDWNARSDASVQDSHLDTPWPECRPHGRLLLFPVVILDDLHRLGLAVSLEIVNMLP